MNSEKLKQIKIVLVEPAGALNVGSIARIMKNMGLRQLVLVNPQCDPHGEEARLMAVHGRDLLKEARQVDNLAQALEGCQCAIATTARSRSLPTTLESPRSLLRTLLTNNLSSAIIFGRENSGLRNDELSYAQRFIEIPANPEYPSLNLAQAVAVCAYELYQATIQPEVEVIKNSTPPNPDIAPIDILEGYYQHLESVLLKIQYLYPHTVESRMEKFRRLFNRANLTEEEVAMLRGILRQTDWAIKDD